MRQLLAHSFAAGILLLSMGALAQTPTPIKGQSSIAQGQVFFTGTATRLIVLSVASGFKAATATGTYAALDTTTQRPYAGAFGACSLPVTLENAQVTLAQVNSSLHYRMRCSDTSDCGVKFKVYTRWAGPTGTDTNWNEAQYLWDSTLVRNTHTPLRRSTTAYSADAKFGVQAARAKVCVERTDVGSGDTVYLTLDWRFW